MSSICDFDLAGEGSDFGQRCEVAHHVFAHHDHALVRLASPLPAPPAELPGDPIVLVVPVRFILR